MNKKALLIVLGLLVVIVAGIIYVASTSTDDVATPRTAEKTNNQTNQPDPVTADPGTPATTPGAYIDYKQDIVAQTSGTKLLFFHAPWCPQCRALETDIKAKGVPNDVTIIKVDYDTNQALRKKYGVTLQTTFVKVDDAGELIEKFTAYDDPTLAAVTAKLL